MTYRLGLTGGIATGKSTVAKQIRAAGFPVVDADEVARAIVQPGEPALAEIQQAFGTQVINADGSLNRHALGQLVFGDPAKLARLNAIDRPFLREGIQTALAEAAASGAKLVVGEIQLLYEADYASCFDGVAVVTTTPVLQKQRLMARDGLDEAEAARRIAAQMPLAEKVRRADFVIDNSLGPARREAQVRELLTKLTK